MGWFDFFQDKIGLSVNRSKKIDREDSKKVSFASPDLDDGAITLEAGGVYGQYIDLDGSCKSDVDLVNRYRDMALHPECESAIDDICTEAIVSDEEHPPVSIVLDRLAETKAVKDRIRDEFDEILQIMRFNRKGYQTFRKWYIESKLYYHIIIDEKNPSKGILEIRPIDPTLIRKVRVIEKDRDESGHEFVKKVEEFFVYNELPQQAYPTSGIRINTDAIVYVTSGLFDYKARRTVGYLHKAIKPLNQLRMIEDAIVIYRLSRAPERRIFYIDVGNLPKQKAEQYLKDIMLRYRNKLVYDAATGEIRDDRKHLSMLEDFWLPRREGGRGTQIDTLQGGQNLGELQDVTYFQKRLYRSLNVPESRLTDDDGFRLGRSTEITRDEVKFTKFVNRLTDQFSEIFFQLLRIQLILKKVITPEEWETIRQDIRFKFLRDSYFAELKDLEVLKERLSVMGDLDKYIGSYFSKDWARRNVFRQSEDEVAEEDKKIKQESSSGNYNKLPDQSPPDLMQDSEMDNLDDMGEDIPETELGESDGDEPQ